MIDGLLTWIVGLPLAAVLGWFAKGLFGPTVDEWGLRIKEVLARKSHAKEYVVFSAFEEIEGRLRELHTEFHHSAFNTLESYLHDKEVQKLVLKHSKRMRRAIASAWIEHTHVGNYAQSDVFFAGMEVLLPYLEKAHLQSIFDKYHDSTQAALWPFLEKVEVRRPEMLSSEMIKYLRAKKVG